MPESRNEIERSLVCAAFAGSDAIDRIQSQLRLSDFADPTCRAIWSSQVRLSDSGQPIDPVTILHDMERHSRVPLDIGANHLAEMFASAWVSAHIDHYCSKLRDFAATDTIRAIGEQMAMENHADHATLDSYIVKIDEIKQGGKQEIATADDAVEALIDRRRSPRAIHRTGIVTLDARLNGGIKDGQLIVVGGRPGTGKSVLLTQMCAGIAMGGEGSLIVSLEMLKEEITDRLSRSQSLDYLRQLPIYFIDTTSDLGAIVSLCRVAARRYKLGVIAVDYLQLCEVANSGRDNRERQIATISRRLKRLANDLKIPIIVGSQLNRESTKRGKPTLADLRESGAIEQDADIVILLSRKEDSEETVIDIAKHRGGACGEITMRMDGASFQFEQQTFDDYGHM